MNTYYVMDLYTHQLLKTKTFYSMREVNDYITKFLSSTRYRYAIVESKESEETLCA